MAIGPVQQPGAEPVAKPPTNKPALPTPAPERRIRRQNAFYHISDAEEAPWRAPEGHHPHSDGTHPTRGTPTPERPESPSPPSLHPPASRSRVSDYCGEGDRLPLPNLLSPFRLSAPQGSQPPTHLPAPPLPQASGVPTLPSPEAGALIPALATQPAPTSPTRPLRGEGVLYQAWFSQTPLSGPAPFTFPPHPYTPTMAPTTPPNPLQSLKRKREDAGDSIDGDNASNKKRTRRPSSDDVD